MPIITLASPFASYRGVTDYPHIYGQVAYPFGGRMFARNWVQPANPQSSIQTSVRSYAALASQAWQTIGAVDKAAWELMAVTASPEIDRDGQAYYLTGQQHYLRCQMYRQLAGLAILDTAPAYSIPLTPGIDTASIDAATDILSIGFDQAIPEDSQVMVELSNRTYSAGRSARENELVLWHEVTATNFVDVDTPALGMDIDLTGARYTLTAAERRGLKITILSDGYMKGQSSVETLTVAAS